MRLTARLLIAVLAILLMGAHGSPQDRVSADEGALRKIVDEYFAAYARHDPDGVIRLWWPQSVGFASRRESIARQFDEGTFSFGAPVVSNVRIEQDLASVRAEFSWTTKDLADGTTTVVRHADVFRFVKKDEEWKIFQVMADLEAFAEALIAAKDETECDTLLRQERRLVSSRLTDEVLQQASLFLTKGDHTRALAAYRVMLKIARLTRSRPDEAFSLRYIGTVYVTAGEYATAADYYKQALAVFEAIADREQIAATNYRLGNTLYLRKDYAEATEAYHRSLKLAESGDKVFVASIQLGLGLSYLMQEDYSHSREFLEQALPAFESAGSKSSLASLLPSLARAQFEQGDYESASETNGKSLVLAESTKDEDGILAAFEALGASYQALGNFGGSFHAYLRALSMAESRNDERRVALLCENLGQILTVRGSFEDAAAYFQRSADLAEKRADQKLSANLLSDWGWLHFAKNDFAGAQVNFEKALARFETLGVRASIASAHLALGLGFAAQVNSEAALAHFESAKSLYEESHHALGVAFALLRIGITQAGLHDTEKAAGALTQAAQDAAAAANLDVMWEAHYRLALLAREAGQPEQAKDELQKALAIIESPQGRVLPSSSNQSFSASRSLPFLAMADLLASKQQFNEALRFAELAKSENLRSVIGNSRLRITEGMNEQEQQQEKQLARNALAMQNRVASAASRGETSTPMFQGLTASASTAAEQLAEFQARIYEAHPAVKIARGDASAIELKDARALLVADRLSAVLEYAVLDDKTYLFVLTQSASGRQAQRRKQPLALDVYSLNITRNELAQRVAQFSNAVSLQGRNVESQARGLYDLLVHPAQARLEGKTRLIIVPSAVLWELPFAALAGPQSHFLIEDYALTLAPSLTALRHTSDAASSRPLRAGRAASVVLVGDEQPGGEAADFIRSVRNDGAPVVFPEARREIDALEQFYGPRRAKLLSKSDATEGRVRQEISSASVLHFATHAVIDDSAPMYSAIILSGAGSTAGEDGLFSAWEAIGLKLQADVTILSRSRVLRGKSGSGEGMLALAWSLWSAGCPSLLLSTWPADSPSTTALLKDFHRRIAPHPAQGLRPLTQPEAWQASIRGLLRNPQYRSPFYWAGFILIEH